jgi:competence protein ComEC
LATTVAAQIPTLPIMLGRLVAPSLWSILANVLITPVVPYAMLFGTISILCGFISPVLMEYVAWGAVPFFAWIISGSLAFATLPAPVVPVFIQPWHELIGHITWVGIWLWHSAKGEGGTSEKNRWYSSSHM